MIDYSLAISIGGAVVSLSAVTCVAIIGFLVKYVLSSTDRRIGMLEQKVETHSSHIASAITQTLTEQRALTGLETAVSDMRTQIQTLSTQIATLLGSMVNKRAPAKR